MLAPIGFAQGWISIIMRCVTTAIFSVKLNGGCSRSFASSRGLRQVDPLLPYLFLFCVEGFSALLKKAQSENNIKGASFGSTAPPCNSLCFLLMTVRLLFF